ncbi:hypothetical protein KIP69_00895 [Geobacter sulfurreducens]|uniref:hypothetical protein n=1 Tax=Geobacter sulfurreducens TaxID=35554 RepID=UPI001BDCFAFD|nr:hypothetical protein [Geobacter sulfurreducens]QVW35439.1 hypothetical protein KIP69_00895 [Geobacter sulfurreducens]
MKILRMTLLFILVLTISGYASAADKKPPQQKAISRIYMPCYGFQDGSGLVCFIPGTGYTESGYMQELIDQGWNIISVVFSQGAWRNDKNYIFYMIKENQK